VILIHQYILEAQKIDFTYNDGTRAIKNLSLKIPGGKKIAVVGNNGAGKTTLFLHFNAVFRPDKGQIIFAGQKIDYSKRQVKNIRKSIGIVFQDPDNQLFSASVLQDVSFGPLNLDWAEEKVKIKVEQALKKTGIWELRDKPTHFLSYGQKKRVAIAGVLAMEPEVIILDEPTAGLDPVYTGQIMELLNDLNKSGTTIILASHNMDEVYAWADYVFVMDNGEIIAEGIPTEIFRDQQILTRSNLKKPWVLEVYDSLVKSGRLENQEKTPTSRTMLLDLLEI